MLTGKLGAIACSTITDFSVVLRIYESLMVAIWRKSRVLMKNVMIMQHKYMPPNTSCAILQFSDMKKKITE
jgi:hypothetical protein